MKKMITVLIFLLSITAFSRNGVWEIVSEKSNPKVRVIFLGDNEELSKTGDSKFGIFHYLNSYITQEDASDLDMVELKYNISDLKSGKAKVISPKADLKLVEKIGVVSKKYANTLKVVFDANEYKNIKVYDKGNKTIVNYNDLYIIFDKGDTEFLIKEVQN